MKRELHVTAVIPTYNRPDDLGECLDSMLIQTLPPKEVIVVDNGKNSRTPELVKRRKTEFANRGIVLKYIRNKGDNSLTIAKNIGVDSSTGDILSFLDDDLILDKDYYREILAVYREKMEALGITGYMPSEQGDVRDLLGRLYIASSFNENGKCRLYPSLTVSYPSPDSAKGVISCDWLSGASTFRREVFKEFRYDEKLKKYSWGEDTDFSHRVFRKHPGTLFLAPRAKYLHKLSETGRIPKREITYMAEVYYLYVFNRIMDQNFGNKAIYLWSRIGALAYRIAEYVLKPTKQKRQEIVNMICAYFFCTEHLGEIKRGDLDFFNKGLT